jgi:ribonuclease BN (tRNA processing enzyme)
MSTQRGLMRGVLLGSGGWIPTGRRETCSALFRHGSNALVVDAGTGLRRLVTDPVLLDGVERLDIVLTHFHLDHVVGLSYLPGLPLSRPPRVWGPGALLGTGPTSSVLERLLAPPLFAASLESITDEVGEIPERGLELGPFDVRVRAQLRHTAPTLAIRLGDDVTYCTDTAHDHGNVEFARGSRVLVHEAWYADDTTLDEHHSAAGEAGRIAELAGVEHLVLIHVNPLQSSEEELAGSARERFPSVSVGRDLDELPLS